MDALTSGTQEAPTKRQRYIDGLRVLASVLEEHPEVDLPYNGDTSPIAFYFLSGADPRAEMAAAARALPCAWRKRVRDDGDGTGVFKLTGELAGLRVEMTAYRDAVCKRVVVGTEDREVEEVVTPAVTRTVTKPVEIVEWECGSLLAPLPAAEPMAIEAGAAADAEEAAA